MKKHVCILFCYNNIDHIIKCVDSLYVSSIDYYVIENKSVNSTAIESYFKTKNIKRYIQFETNISNNALRVFFNDYKNELLQYDYITVTDCDLYLTDANSTFDELKKNLDFLNVGMSCVDLSMENYPHEIAHGQNWIPDPIRITDDYIECSTGGHLMTLKQKDAYIFYNEDPFIDGGLMQSINNASLIWVKTKINKAVHLTWDLYVHGNEYFEYKKLPNIWNHNKYCNYKQII